MRWEALTGFPWIDIFKDDDVYSFYNIDIRRIFLRLAKQLLWNNRVVYEVRELRGKYSKPDNR